MSYDEHLISMAGGDRDTTDQLAGIISKALGDVTGIYDTTDAEDKALADAIIAAGFGLVREAKADAWQEGWAHYRKYFSPNFPEFGINPYGAVTVRGGE